LNNNVITTRTTTNIVENIEILVPTFPMVLQIIEKHQYLYKLIDWGINEIGVLTMTFESQTENNHSQTIPLEE
jgi:hypothetical protein